MNGFVQLRRGLLEHLETGRMTSDEGIAFTVVLMKVNRYTQTWKGNGKALAQVLHWCERKGRLVLASLNRKGYVQTHRLPGMRGSSYAIRVPKFQQPITGTGMPVIGYHRHRDAALLQEVILQEKERTASAAPKTEKQRQTDRELRIGAGPRPSRAWLERHGRTA